VDSFIFIVECLKRNGQRGFRYLRRDTAINYAISSEIYSRIEKWKILIDKRVSYYHVETIESSVEAIKFSLFRRVRSVDCSLEVRIALR